MAFITIFKKEVRMFFSSSWLLAIFAIYSLLLAVRYLITIEQFIQMSMMPQGKAPNIHDVLFIPHINWVYMIFLILIPMLCMRLISEERKNGTMDLLLTSPITTLDIVVGKFLAGWLVALALVFLALLFPLATSLVSTFDWGPLIGSYLGMALLAGFNIALCLVASSMTSSSVLSGFFGFLFILIVMIFGSSGMQVENPIFSMILEQFSLGTHLRDFFQGIVNTKSLVFLISGTLFLCFTSHKIVNQLRYK